MTGALRKLIDISSDALAMPIDDWAALDTALAFGAALQPLLSQKNGFYAFESALHVYPFAAKPSPQNLRDWNTDSVWKSLYPAPARELTYFAEDVFGAQFGIGGDGIFRLDIETGDLERHSDNLAGWAQRILSDSEFETGHPFAHAWQHRNGPLPSGVRLAPKQLFVLGGAFDLANMYAIEALKGIRYRADLASQIRGLADGTRVKLTITD
jgi:hypothetical protein